ncbi:MAG: hypothetical protein A3C07_02705 [Candidatus Sungbacteria bacterium RIFCSPHIGHO2_02_FULL_47_11]|uniref:Peptidase M50 domain-containing protein n=1 Tax=Candidatus Sungbacteria bacterium RIFCSPHIGHO2_02_FULL_47_11 TaxID=1802270 RepID=A0A1G2KHW2_9BACT|nr:MAG: hypothetical protein A3C07_02705 [Candidatus Sungbacteria bacterium RIFCSPHIGHO2_02_FULL_47_11]
MSLLPLVTTKERCRMLATFTVILCLFAITFHELGHAYAMYRCGVPIERIGLLGVPVKGVPFLKKDFTLNGNVTRFEIHPLIIGAFVKEKDGSLDLQSVLNRVYIFGAGPLVNILYAAVLFSISGIRIPTATLWGQEIWLLGWMPAIAIATFLFFKPLCRFVVPTLGLVMLVSLAAALLLSENPQESVAGPVTLIHILGNGYAKMEPFGIFATTFIAGIFSLLIGISNTLPFVPLDGGRIFHTYLEKIGPHAGQWFFRFSFVLFLALVFLALSNDFMTLIS